MATQLVVAVIFVCLVLVMVLLLVDFILVLLRHIDPSVIYIISLFVCSHKDTPVNSFNSGSRSSRTKRHTMTSARI